MYDVEYVGSLLSRREGQVFCAMAQGLGYKRIGNALGIEADTVKKHGAAIYDALGLDDSVDDKRTAAVCKGLLLGIIRLVDVKQ